MNEDRITMNKLSIDLYLDEINRLSRKHEEGELSKKDFDSLKRHYQNRIKKLVKQNTPQVEGTTP